MATKEWKKESERVRLVQAIQEMVLSAREEAEERSPEKVERMMVVGVVPTVIAWV